MVSERFLRAYRFLCYEVLFLIAFGGSVRAMDAGLACPDWPLCFGQYIPDFHIQVYFEFIHRVLAGTVGLLVAGLGFYLIFKKGISTLVKVLSGVSMVAVLAQIVLGGLTVLMLLHENVVAAHLVLATVLFASLLWIYWDLRRVAVAPTTASAPLWQKSLSIVVVGVVWLQILIGGLVASNYAGMACPSFPLCHGKLIPTLSGLVGLQVIHRLVAYLCVAVIFVLWLSLLKTKADPNFRKWAGRAMIAVLLQVGLGIANVLFVIPPLITVLHLAVATYLLGATLRVSYLMIWAKPVAHLPGAREQLVEKPQFG